MVENSLTNNQTTSQPPNDKQTKNDAFVLPSSFTIRLTMKSDWHIGTGAGRPGSVDKLIARDADGFPFVPAKTLNGIWRDAMETLTLGLDNGGKDGNGQPKYEWQKFVELVFGAQPNQIKEVELASRLSNSEKTYSRSLLSIHPARLNEQLRKKIHSFDRPDKQRFLSALTFIKPGVAIDEHSGTAKPDFLRFEEMGRSGAVLETVCELNYCDETIWALLVASAKLVERIGGKRRRGAGLCELKVFDEKWNEISVTQAIHHLRSFKDKSAPKVPEFKAQTDEGEYDLKKISSPDEWQRLKFSLTLKTPVSIVTATLGNVSESLDFIPGTYLLPYFTKKLGRQIFNAVAYGDFQVSPATIEINNERGLPVPKAIYYDKAGGGFDKQKDGKSTAYNSFTESEKIKTGEQKKGYRNGYVSSLDENGKKLPSFKNTPKTLLMHNVVKDEVQRPTEEVGGVFSREAIAAGKTLRGEIRLKKTIAENLDSGWHKKLNGAVRLGTSRKDDYGLAELEISGEPEEVDSPFPFDLKYLTVYLLSDLLLRNVNLRQTNLVDDLARAICQKLNEGVDDESQKVCLQATKSLIQTRRIESWHEGWGFPRPTLIAMAAGSCVVFEVTNRSLDLEKLKQLEAAGIGERRGEGYGQVRFNPPLLTNQINGWAEADKPREGDAQTNDGASELKAEEKEFAKFIEETAWREELKVVVLKIADGIENRKKIFGFDSNKEEPPMSQIGGLRSVIARLRDQSDRAMVTGWIDHLKATPNRRDKWAKSKDEAEKKLDGIKKLIMDESKVWSILCEMKIDGRNVWKSLPTLVKSREDLQKKLWAEAVRSLFDACARAHKRELEKKEKD